MPRFYLPRPRGAPALDREHVSVVHGFKVPGFKNRPNRDFEELILSPGVKADEITVGTCRETRG